jgi:VanZ family protein
MSHAPPPETPALADEPARSTTWFPPPVRWCIWAFYAVAWTRALLVENPVDPGDDALLQFQLFLFSKTVHVCAYAVFAGLSGWLPVRFRYRWWLLLVLSGHAFATEFGQQYFITRHPSVRDAGLDHIGMLLGVLATWHWWRRRP